MSLDEKIQKRLGTGDDYSYVYTIDLKASIKRIKEKIDLIPVDVEPDEIAITRTQVKRIVKKIIDQEMGEEFL